MMELPRKPPGADTPLVYVGSDPLTVSTVVKIAHGGLRVAVDPSVACRERIRASVRSLHQQLEAGAKIYGVTTGVGESCEIEIPADRAQNLSANLIALHGCGTGEVLGDVQAAAVIAARLASLARGYSGVREIVLDRLADLLNRGILPRIPAEGSVGASGDLTPLSYLAAALIGEREVSFKGKICDAASALRACDLDPLVLGPKEGLALLNGTSVMTGLACLAYERAEALANLSCSITAMMSDALRGNRAHFDERIFALKPHPGQVAAAERIRRSLDYGRNEPTHSGRIQDRYSIRCAPHVIGVLFDALAWIRPMLEIEINSVNDNPIIDAESNEVLHGGNFYGGHVGFAMDSLKVAVASVADLLDRQIALLCNPTMSNGLPGDLVATNGPDRPLNHGFKAMQITSSSLAAEALKHSVPATIFSRSTESHNQDKVSMGTIASRDCLRVLDLSETVAAIGLIAACQGWELRPERRQAQGLVDLHRAVRGHVRFNDRDRRQDVDILTILEVYRTGSLPPAEPGGDRLPG